VWSTITGGEIGLIVAGTAVDGFKPKRSWVDAGLGATLSVAKNTEIFFDADVEFGLDKSTKAGSGTVGLRFNW
jgi:outer membrane autotransporter protein